MSIHKHSKLISQFAKMVEAGHPINKIVQKACGGGHWCNIDYPEWYEGIGYRVAIAFVEGKPVFTGDVLYCGLIKICVMGYYAEDGDGICVGIRNNHREVVGAEHLSWNLPAKSDVQNPKFKVGDEVFVNKKIMINPLHFSLTKGDIGKIVSGPINSISGEKLYLIKFLHGVIFLDCDCLGLIKQSSRIEVSVNIDADYVAKIVDEVIAEHYIKLTPHEIQSRCTRVDWAEKLIRQLPESHEGRNSWLMNYGSKRNNDGEKSK